MCYCYNYNKCLYIISKKKKNNENNVVEKNFCYLLE